jgi:hypothetical protein
VRCAGPLERHHQSGGNVPRIVVVSPSPLVGDEIEEHCVSVLRLELYGGIEVHVQAGRRQKHRVAERVRNCAQRPLAVDSSHPVRCNGEPLCSRRAARNRNARNCETREKRLPTKRAAARGRGKSRCDTEFRESASLSGTCTSSRYRVAEHIQISGPPE